MLGRWARDSGAGSASRATPGVLEGTADRGDDLGDEGAADGEDVAVRRVRSCPALRPEHECVVVLEALAVIGALPFLSVLGARMNAQKPRLALNGE